MKVEHILISLKQAKTVADRDAITKGCSLEQLLALREEIKKLPPQIERGTDISHKLNASVDRWLSWNGTSYTKSVA